jgi:DNA-binding helix-hairpin-helix protein with protein kinase domain
MNQIIFRNDMDRTRQIILWSMLFLLVLLVAAGIMLFFGGPSLYPAIEIIAALGWIIFLLASAFLWLIYLRKSEVREKRRIQSKMGEIQIGLQEAQTNLADVLHKLESIRQNSQEQQRAEQQKFDSLNKELENKIAESRIAQDKELVYELAQIQTNHLETGLKANQLDPTDIPGIGNVLIGKLNEAGIHTVYDVTSEAIQAIPGFGESKALSLVRWRETVERALQETQPQALPDQLRSLIDGKYSEQRMKLQVEKAAAQTATENMLQEFQEKESQDLAAEVEQEASARQRLADLEAQDKDNQELRKQYSQITFPRMFVAVLIKDQTSWQERILAYLAFISFVLVGVFHGIFLAATLISHRFLH